MSKLTAEHQQYLEEHAVDADQALALGVQSVLTEADLAVLPNEWRAGGIGRKLPEHGGILFPWTSADGRVNVQLRPDEDKRPLDEGGEPMKYIYQSGRPPVLWAVRPVKKPAGVLIAEGSKQCLVAARYAPEGWSVFGMAGCWGFSHEDQPITDLEVVDGLPVVVALDADAGHNFSVYTAGTRLGVALKAEGADSVKWLQLPAGGKLGLDDVLAKRKPERRAVYLENLVKSATLKVAEKAPAAGKQPAKKPDTGERALVIVSRDRLAVISELTDALVTRFSGSTLFSHGGVISELAPAVRMEPVDKGRFNNVVQQAAVTVKEVESRGNISYPHEWPDSNTMAAVLRNADKFTPLDRLTRTPFVRPDGTVCTAAGYDEATRTILAPDPVLEGLEVADEPTAGDVEAARELLLTEWLGDFPFEGPADRANMLALTLTPFIRSLVPLVPLAVVDGTGKGVGKNLLADCLSILFTGQRDAKPMPYTTNDEENRKVITSAFRQGSDLFVFDEAHEIEGASFARAITSITYQDRILGVSKLADFPNQVTWISLGNNVHVQGDMIRRVYRIRIAPDCDAPEDRPASSFRHPGVSGLDLRTWTQANRAALLRACLVLVRAWHAAGQPAAPRSTSFGSFERWEEMVAGICALAGVPGFLENLAQWRGNSDFKAGLWTAHLQWLHETFGELPFQAADVKQRATGALDRYDAPPDLADPVAKDYAQHLGKAYARLGQPYGGLRLTRAGGGEDGKGKGGRVKWAIRSTSSTSEGSVGSVGSVAPTPDPLRASAGEVSDLPRDDPRSRYVDAEGGQQPTQPTQPTPAPALSFDGDELDALLASVEERD